jgi:hypothetical protein
MRTTFVAISLMVTGSQILAGEAKPLQVFILAGQSNMVGKRSNAQELPEELQRAQPIALIFTGSEWTTVRPGVTEKMGFGPEISFCQRITQSQEAPIGIIKLSVGGTSLASDWSPERPKSLYGKLRTHVEQARKSRDFEVVGMIWMQGGRDAKSKSMAEAYEHNLRSFIQRARRDFQSPDMLFVCGRSAAPQNKYPHVKDVRKAQESIDLPSYAWVDCDSIAMGKDGVHYSTDGQVQAGYLFADAMIELLKSESNIRE